MRTLAAWGLTGGGTGAFLTAWGLLPAWLARRARKTRAGGSS